MGLLILSTIAYWPLVVVVLLNIYVPARRVLQAGALYGSPGDETSRDASRQAAIGVVLLVGLTIGQCGVLAYSVPDLRRWIAGDAAPEVARPDASG